MSVRGFASWLFFGLLALLLCFRGVAPFDNGLVTGGLEIGSSTGLELDWQRRRKRQLDEGVDAPTGEPPSQPSAAPSGFPSGRPTAQPSR